MEEKQRSKVKMFLSAAVVFTSFYYSFLFAIGIIAGYILFTDRITIFIFFDLPLVSKFTEQSEKHP